MMRAWLNGLWRDLCQKRENAQAKDRQRAELQLAQIKRMKQQTEWVDSFRAKRFGQGILVNCLFSLKGS